MILKNALRTATAAMLLAPMALFAIGTSETPLNPTTTEQSQKRTTSPTATENRFSREQWGLSETERERYSTLMQGVPGSISPATVSPIEVLGVNAEKKKNA